jgi:hypothetical protein
LESVSGGVISPVGAENREEALTLLRRRKSTREAGPEASRSWCDPVEGRPPTWMGFRDKLDRVSRQFDKVYKPKHSRYINQNIITLTKGAMEGRLVNPI